MSGRRRFLAICLVVLAAAVGIARLVRVDAGTSTSSSPASTASPNTVSPSTVSPGTVSPGTVPPGTVPPTTATPVTVPPSTVAATTLPRGEGCSATGASAAIDRDAQRAWLCRDGLVLATFPITSAITLPDPGTYSVYAKDLHASSTFGGHYSTMTHFVAFTYGKYTGARVAFHSVPTFPGGAYVQPLSSVGDLSRRGESSGCIRVLPDDAVRIWDTLQIGDQVTVLN